MRKTAKATAVSDNPVIFVGAGPGDPELITVKGARLLAEADLVIYAGSLVSPAILGHCRKGCEIVDSAALALEEIVAVIAKRHGEGRRVVRLHTGDPALYGAIAEQFIELDRLGIPYAVVPGVSSAFASAAALRREFTAPGITQTVIFTRMAGRTPVPETESLASLAAHGATLVIFLSVSSVSSAAATLAKSYGADCPAAVVYRASWPDERVVRGTLADIAGKVKEAGIKRQALILVGPFLAAELKEYSKLYDPSFEHGWRKAGD